MKNRPQNEMTATPDKYPQKKFNPKPCKTCKTVFEPMAPSHQHCSQECADKSIVSAYLMRRYKINYDDYARMLEEQGSVCKICKGEGFCMAKHHKLKLVVDHCHATGEVRGLLCHNCNRALGLLKDSIDSLSNALDYIKTK